MDSTVGIRLERLINELIDRTSSDLGNGNAADYAAYLKLVGYIQGLRDALKLVDEVEHNINRGN